MQKSLHPFPARMAPELALERLSMAPAGSRILDPMTGSGTVVHQACALGHEAVGFDVDPLAIMMSRVATSAVDPAQFQELGLTVARVARATKARRCSLHWIDKDDETRAFIEFWFGKPQRDDLRRLAFVIDRISNDAADGEQPMLDALRLAVSRLIITKDSGASLARDVSHSRPHRVVASTNYDVLTEFERSVRTIAARLPKLPAGTTAAIGLGDARALQIAGRSIDRVLTSPPYLNAIDYMRGHRMSLVWLGYSLGTLRRIRGESIGSERSMPEEDERAAIRVHIGQISDLPNRFRGMIERYVADLLQLVREVARVLKTDGEATFVIGNSCLRGVFIRNADALEAAASVAGLTTINRFDRELPEQHRYLPLTGSSLGKRMRTETILTFAHTA